jgi:hypothetical protein
MPTVQIKAQLSLDDLLRAIEQLSTSELERSVSQVISLQAHCKAPGVSKEEAKRKRSHLPNTTNYCV